MKVAKRKRGAEHWPTWYWILLGSLISYSALMFFIDLILLYYHYVR